MVPLWLPAGMPEMAPHRGLSWTQTRVVIGPESGAGIWSDGAAPEPEVYENVRLELIYNVQTKRSEVRLFDRMGYELRDAVVLEHSSGGGKALIRTTDGVEWNAAKVGDCGCG